MKKIPTLIASFSLLSACAVQQPVFHPVELPMPPKPVLPLVMPSDLHCLPVQIRKKVEERDTALFNYAKALRAVLCSNRPNCTP